MIRNAAAVLISVLVVAGCALRLGGPSPEAYPTVALSVTDGSGAEQVASRVASARPRLVILAADRDSAWFAEVAQRTSRTLSGPGRAGATAFAFLGDEPVGDTTLWLRLDAGDSIPVHDALYRVDDDRFVDMLAIGVPAGTDPRQAIRALLAYVATDVPPHAAVVLGVLAPETSGDTIATLLQPIFADATTCGSSPLTDPGMLLFYGPAARVDCEATRAIEGQPPGVFARLIVRS